MELMIPKLKSIQGKNLAYTEENKLLLTDLSIYLQSISGIEGPVYSAITTNLDLINDPIINCSLKSKELVHLILMRQKSRILVKESATLMGVIDPFGILKQSEIFVQIKREFF